MHGGYSFLIFFVFMWFFIEEICGLCTLDCGMRWYSFFVQYRLFYLRTMEFIKNVGKGCFTVFFWPTSFVFEWNMGWQGVTFLFLFYTCCFLWLLLLKNLVVYVGVGGVSWCYFFSNTLWLCVIFLFIFFYFFIKETCCLCRRWSDAFLSYTRRFCVIFYWRTMWKYVVWGGGCIIRQLI